MPGSSFNIACTDIMLNAAVAEELRQFADELEKAGDFQAALDELIRREIRAHKRIIFNGNGYGDEWPAEAEKRGLLNWKTTPDALPHFTDEKNVKMFKDHGIYTRSEIESRQEIALEEYAKTIRIEALTSLDILKKQIIPAAITYSGKLAGIVAKKK